MVLLLSCRRTAFFQNVTEEGIQAEAVTLDLIEKATVFSFKDFVDFSELFFTGKGERNQTFPSWFLRRHSDNPSEREECDGAFAFRPVIELRDIAIDENSERMGFLPPQASKIGEFAGWLTAN